jgi:hypothetical protein
MITGKEMILLHHSVTQRNNRLTTQICLVAIRSYVDEPLNSSRKDSHYSSLLQ